MGALARDAASGGSADQSASVPVLPEPAATGLAPPAIACWSACWRLDAVLAALASRTALPAARFAGRGAKAGACADGTCACGAVANGAGAAWAGLLVWAGVAAGWRSAGSGANSGGAACKLRQATSEANRTLLTVV